MRLNWFSAVLAAAGILATSVHPAEPVIHMLVPGFTVRELPVKLSNLNNLRFSPDGRLTALAYDGRVWILRDTDGDGLEDVAEPYWSKQTMSVPVGMAWAPEGLYVSSHSKISLLRDTTGSGKADLEEEIVSDWPPTDVGAGGVDATGLVRDGDGNLYFGLMAANFENPYRIRDGVSRYDLHSPRGTIQKWNRKTRKLETVCTGIRLAYALAFNREGDLFATDQEGETWLKGANALDELNQIIPGRHYGFPPRHDKYLPNVIDEPPVVAFGPQHQSTCGFVFNDETPDHHAIGPSWWKGDAFVVGESRGKLWRVRLVKTPNGYVGQETLIACIGMLTTDVVLSPKGDLYLCCHSGAPDWGEGPRGEGKIFKISYTDHEAPQPIAAWPSGANEVRVAFDRPIDPTIVWDPGKIRIEAGEFVTAGDRYEILKPPYKTVFQQEGAPRRSIAVRKTKLVDDGRMLILETSDSVQLTEQYGLTIPGVRPPHGTSGEMVDLAFNNRGAELRIGSDPPVWLPAPDLAVARELARPRALGPVADGANAALEIRFQLPAEDLEIETSSSQPFELYSGEHSVNVVHETDRPNVARLRIADQLVGRASPRVLTNSPSSSAIEQSPAVVIALKSPNQMVSLSYTRPGDPTPRPLTPSMTLMPGARINAPISADSKSTSKLAGPVTGNAAHGRELFFGDRLKCATCHRIFGEGALIGPDLSNLHERDAASVLRDITEPNASINPSYVTYQIQRSDGEIVLGLYRGATADVIQLQGADGKMSDVPRSEIKEMRPSLTSLMPTGLLDGLSAADRDDLMHFLLTVPAKNTK